LINSTTLEIQTVVQPEDRKYLMSESLKQRLDILKNRLTRPVSRAGRKRNSVRLIGVTKNHDHSVVQALIDSGVRDIGENRVQEILKKVPVLHGD
jgi:uncharacterized pyridoxal phosphate-containing UPF0001 family protein